MNSLNVISINPGESTQAALHPELLSSGLRSRVRNGEGHNLFRTPSLFRDRVDFLTGISNSTSAKSSLRMLIVRLTIGMMLAAFGGYLLHGNLDLTVGITCIVMGLSIATGFLTRIVSFAAISMLTFMFWNSLVSPNPTQVIWLAPAIPGLFFSIFGPGIYSVDSIIRKTALRLNKSYRQKRAEKEAADRLSYKAFRYQTAG
ncbi:MAG: DoxX family protein [Muribaculaceae bacterium]|nr:DoxX family protein [Muribaculaceae bacterium]